MSLPLVVPDATVLLKWVLPGEEEPDVDRSLLLRAAIVGETIRAIVPTLWLFEVGNTIARRFPDQASAWLLALVKFGLSEYPPSQLWLAKTLDLTNRHASEDAEPARRIRKALQAVGIDVWFDQSELRVGDAWDVAIHAQVKACALFMPVISANSHRRSEGYFRLEWKLAVDRSHLMAADRAFLVPVVVDETKEANARVPDGIRTVQWTSLPGGAAVDVDPSLQRRALRRRPRRSPRQSVYKAGDTGNGTTCLRVRISPSPPNK